MPIKENLLQLISHDYPTLQPSVTESLISDNLLSPFHLNLSKDVLTQAQAIVRDIFQFRQSSACAKTSQFIDPGNKSILMSYDFHLSDDGVLKLIEINTNASFLAMGHLMYEAHQLAHPIAQFSLLDIVQNIHEEFALNGQRGEPQIAIIDEEPEQQRLYIEFLVYNQLFQKAGLQSQICDFRKIPANVNFVYNRYTDFYFSRPESELLLQDFTTKKRCFSPNPYEYDLLANKQRLIDWNTQGLFQKHLPKAHLVTDENLEMLWQNKKSFFFKPLTSFGSKQSYRGEKMTRKILQAMPNGFIAQEYIEPPSENFQTPSGPIKFKYDLRFYAYQDKVQCAVARLYQGQLTNLKTPLGGFAPIVFHSEDLKHPTRVST